MPQVQVLQDAPHALLAQLVEQRTLNPKVVGSIPSRRTILQGGRAVMQQLHKLPDVGLTPTPATTYVACSSEG